MVNLRDFQCSYISLANRLTPSSTAASKDSSISAYDRTGGLSTAANGCFACAVSSKNCITISNWFSEHRVEGSRFSFIILRKTSSSSTRLYGHPQQSSTVDEKRMYVAGCEKVGGYSSSYRIELRTVSGVGILASLTFPRATALMAAWRWISCGRASVSLTF